MGRARRLVDVYRFPAFRPRAAVCGVFGDPKARVVRLERRGKKPCVESAVGPRAESTNRHWDGIAAYCRPENKVSLGFVEGLNNKIRVLQRRAYGLRDEEYLRLKILTSMLPEI
jgi:hypothetical protein